MVSPLQNSGRGAAPLSIPSKSAVAEPQLDDTMELASVAQPDGSAPEVPQEDDIMQLARLGDVTGMEKMFETGEYDATFSDDEGITPLHWAAINNQYAMCQFLIQHGAEINKKGGESIATPLQWAAQRSHYYTVNLLLQHGADPLATDAQGYNTLHISTFNGNVLLITLLLHQGIPVDVLDMYGHTSLMWAAYKGFPSCVDIFLRWGASVHATDEQGFTGLHWALVKGNPSCIMKMVEYGADRFAQTETGKTPAVTASELNTQPAWHRALKECGFDQDGHPATPPWPGASYFLKDKTAFTTRFLFLWPLVLVWGVLFVLSRAPIFLGIPLAILVVLGVTWVAKQVLEYAPANLRHFHKTPWLPGIFSASLFLVGINWIMTVAPSTAFPPNSHFLLNLIFAALFFFTSFFYIAAMRYDPGYVPKLKGIAEQRAVIDELLKDWKYDEANFCTTCMIRTPLRSKHCRRCQRCVAKHDHHCPWVYNCVGVNNHRPFVMYLVNLTFGILFYDWLLYHYLTFVSADASDSCNLLSPGLCKVVNSDGYTFLLAIWITLQLIWVVMLIATQLIQVSRAMTTYENMMGINTGTGNVATAFSSTGTPLDPNHATVAPPSGAAPASALSSKQKGGMLRQWSRLLGVDPFLETIAGRGAATGKDKKIKKNPYSRGCILNCKDFWCDPAPIFSQRENGTAILGGDKVDYTVMYESPTLMRINGMRSRGGYEAVATEDVSRDGMDDVWAEDV